MKRQAQIQDGVVQNIWQSERGEFPQPPDETWTFVDVTGQDVQVGDLYDGRVFSRPPGVPRLARLSRFAFMSLLTPQEFGAVTTTTDPQLGYAMKLLQFAEYIEPSHPLVTQMLDYVEGLGLMTSQRRTEFMAAVTARAK